ncbi:MAG: hypothetical protein OWS03_05980, partial [Alicyclobacillaceae bacterium]|nr:hypothetical protein [Alicyclobacillaceae bacterium]
VRWRRIWRLYSLGSSVPYHLRVVHSARSVHNDDLHHNPRILNCQSILADRLSGGENALDVVADKPDVVGLRATSFA